MSRWLASLGAIFGIFAVAAIAGMILTCGQADTAMPEPEPCPSPSPTPTTRRDPLGFYRFTIERNVERLYRLTAEFRDDYPDGKFSRSGAFRPAFARYADDTVCIARYLRDLALHADLAAVEAAFDRSLDDFISHQLAGREAVRARNVSDYRAWNKGVDEYLAALRRVGAVVP